VIADAAVGKRKAAVLLVQMGKEKSARILAQMRDSEVEELTAEIARLDRIDENEVDGVLDEFAEIVAARSYHARGGLGYARELLEASVGEERAGEILSRLTAAMMEMPFHFLRRADPRQLLSFLQDEHPQTIALVLAHISADQAAVILAGLPPDQQATVAARIATMDRTTPEVIKQVESALERKLSSMLQPNEYSSVGGLEPLIDIINRSDRATERLILEGLERLDPKVAEEVRSQMFVFEDIVSLDDRSIQLVLRQVETADLATALKGVRDDVREKIMSNISERAAENLADEIELLGPVRLKVVEESQGRIVQVIRSLEEAGQIVIARGADDELVD
jgi:flagellar motor switch protein FliG